MQIFYTPRTCSSSDYFLIIAMIIKQPDDKQSQIAFLTELLAHPEADSTIRKNIQKEIRFMQAGIKAEKEAAYEMKLYWGNLKNWMILNDLRIEHDGFAAQIDHLLINRWLEMWVCESKHFANGVEINEHGEFKAFFGNKPYGIPSPIEQNNRHILILQRFFDSGVVKLPTRLGFTLKPVLRSLVLVSKGARIDRPEKKIDELSCIVKNDQLFKTIDKTLDESNPLIMAKLIGQGTLEEVARDIAGQHKPIQFNWAARFGLSTIEKIPVSAVCEAVPSWQKTTDSKATATDPGTKRAVGAAILPPEKQHHCHACGAAVTDKVVRFCLGNISRFSGKVYCLACQKTVPAAGKQSAEPALNKPGQKRICHACGVPLTYSVARFCWTNTSRFGGLLYCMDCQKTV